MVKPVIRRIGILDGADVGDEAAESLLEVPKEGVRVELQLLDATDSLDLEVGRVAFQPASLDRKAVGEPVTERIPQMVNIKFAGKSIRAPARIHVVADEGFEVRGAIASWEFAGVELAEGLNGTAEACSEAQQRTLALQTPPVIPAHAPERQQDDPLDPAAEIPKLLGFGEIPQLRAVIVDPPGQATKVLLTHGYPIIDTSNLSAEQDVGQTAAWFRWKGVRMEGVFGVMRRTSCGDPNTGTRGGWGSQGPPPARGECEDGSARAETLGSLLISRCGGVHRRRGRRRHGEQGFAQGPPDDTETLRAGGRGGDGSPAGAVPGGDPEPQRDRRGGAGRGSPGQPRSGSGRTAARAVRGHAPAGAGLRRGPDPARPDPDLPGAAGAVLRRRGGSAGADPDHPPARAGPLLRDGRRAAGRDRLGLIGGGIGHEASGSTPRASTIRG